MENFEFSKAKRKAKQKAQLREKVVSCTAFFAIYAACASVGHFFDPLTGILCGLVVTGVMVMFHYSE